MSIIDAALKDEGRERYLSFKDKLLKKKDKPILRARRSLGKGGSIIEEARIFASLLYDLGFWFSVY